MSMRVSSLSSQWSVTAGLLPSSSAGSLYGWVLLLRLVLPLRSQMGASQVVMFYLKVHSTEYGKVFCLTFEYCVTVAVCHARFPLHSKCNPISYLPLSHHFESLCLAFCSNLMRKIFQLSGRRTPFQNHT